MPRILHADQMKKCIGCYSCMLACARTVHQDFSPYKSAIQIRSVGGLQSRLVADICRGCKEPPCAAACNCGSLTPRPGGGVRFKKEKCLGCGDCVDACVIGVIRFDREENRPIICIQCGTCVRYCPHEVLSMEEAPPDA